MNVSLYDNNNIIGNNNNGTLLCDNNDCWFPSKSNKAFGIVSDIKLIYATDTPISIE